MKYTSQFFVWFCFHIYHVYSAKLPGPLVYVVTPSSKPSQLDMARASPFYYHNWMRRMDSPEEGVTSTTTTTTSTPDLIFAEFESGKNNLKSIRKLLEKEKFRSKPTTTITSRPIYVPDEDTSASDSNYGLHQTTTEKPEKTDMTDYFALYNNLHGTGPMYVPSAQSASVPVVPTTTTTTTTEQTPENSVQNIWHIIDSQKQDQFSGQWKEEPTDDSSSETNSESNENEASKTQGEDEETIDDNFALPGFGTNPGNGGENESRAIRTEPNIRFPYVNLKPFKMKNFNSKKVNNMFNLDSFTEIKNPIRGEVQDTVMVPIQQPIDRYNPAQPYLPSYGTKSKQSGGNVVPVAPAPPSRPVPSKAFANLVPPPPPPAPQISGDDFPTPSTYESFPPYAPSGPVSGSSFSFPPSAPSGADSSSDSDDGPPPGYRYKPASSVTIPPPPASSALPFIPTVSPVDKPSSYDNPPMVGYSYDKPPMTGYSYDKPPMAHEDTPPAMDMDDKPDFQGYHYNKPVHSPPPSSPPSSSQQDYSAPSYGHHDSAPPPSYQSGHDYPELIYDKPHGMGDMKGGVSGKDNDLGMMPPPPADAKPDSMGPPMDDHGFPHDFPGDIKYSHDFDDHDFHHHHHHHTTTTTTTEQPRVNRYSYYYLGKKLYYLPLYFSVYFVVYVGALIIKAVLRHKITYPNSFRPNGTTASFFSKRSIESHLSNDNLHEITGRVTKAITTAAEKYISEKSKAD